jgi:FimV-like protein
MCREIGDRMGEGRALNNLGIVAVTQGKYEQAESNYQQALRISRMIGQRSFEMSALDNLGNLAAYRYHYSLAQKYHLEALAGARQSGDRVSESFAWINLARAYLAMGDYEQAQEAFQDLVDLNRQLNDQQGTCHALIYLSLLLVKTGDIQSAQVYVEDALKLAQEGDLRSEIGWAVHVLACVHSHQHRFSDTAEHFRKAVEFRQELDEVKEVIESQAGLAGAFLELGNLEGATSLVEAILSDLTDHGLEGFEQPVEILLTCYRILQVSDDPRAPDVLRQGYQLLKEIASRIEDESQRRSYLERVPENRALLQIWQDSGLAAPAPPGL